jgi:hypothetical protein
VLVHLSGRLAGFGALMHHGESDQIPSPYTTRR